MPEVFMYYAGPGTGKTRTLMEGVREDVDSGISPYSIIPLTFSREGAGEITTRLNGDVAGTTNHSKAKSLDDLNCSMLEVKPPKVINESRVISLLERSVQECGYAKENIKMRDITSSMSYIRERLLPPKTVKKEIRDIVDHYTATLRSENLTDFTGILERGVLALDNPDVSAMIEGSYIYIDEFQDTNRLQWEFLRKMILLSQRTTLLTSPAQEIYRFSGCGWEWLFPEVQKLSPEVTHLTENHRSVRQIVEAGTYLATQPDGQHQTPARPDEGWPIRVIEASNQDTELDLLSKLVLEYNRLGYEWKDIAILIRTHEQGIPIQKTFAARNIPFELVSGQNRSISSNPIMLALLGYLEMFFDPVDPEVLERIVNVPACGWGNRTNFSLRQDGRLNWEHIANVVSKPEKYRAQIVQRARHIAIVRDRLARLRDMDMPLTTRMEEIVKITGLLEYVQTDGDFLSTKLLEKTVQSAVEYRSVGDMICDMRDMLSRDTTSEGVQIITYHASKGLGKGVVIIPNAIDGVTPIKGGDDTEERNLFYVALTRTIDRAIITWPATSGKVTPFLLKIPSYLKAFEKYPAI